MVGDGEFCDTVCAFSRRPKDMQCQRHDVSNTGESGHTLKVLDCKVRLDIIRFTPHFGMDLVISQGEHTHPPPPRAKIPAVLQDEITQHIHRRPTQTAMRVMASADLWGDGVCSGRTSRSR
jgi:hypothetical protein